MAPGGAVRRNGAAGARRPAAALPADGTLVDLTALPAAAASPVRVVVHGDKRLFREGLALLVDADPEMTVVALASDAALLLEACDRVVADAALVDIESDDIDAEGLIAAMRSRWEELWIVGLYQTLSLVRAEQLYGAGVDALVGGTAGIGRILRALRSAGDASDEDRSREASRAVHPAGLTAREVDVLRLVAVGATNKDISSRLLISPKTVESHKQHLYSKLGVQTQAHAVAVALREGWLGEERSAG